MYRENVTKATLVSDDIESWSTLENKYNTLQNVLENILLTQEYVNLRDSLSKLDKQVVTLLPTNTQKEYVKIYKKCEDVTYYTEKTFVAAFADLLDAQNGYIQWSKSLEKK
jgi:hypothetical protein